MKNLLLIIIITLFGCGNTEPPQKEVTASDSTPATQPKPVVPRMKVYIDNPQVFPVKVKMKNGEWWETTNIYQVKMIDAVSTLEVVIDGVTQTETNMSSGNKVLINTTKQKYYLEEIAFVANQQSDKGAFKFPEKTITPNESTAVTGHYSNPIDELFIFGFDYGPNDLVPATMSDKSNRTSFSKIKLVRGKDLVGEVDEFFEANKEQIEKMTYKPPVSKTDANVLSANNKLYNETLKNLISKKLKRGDSPVLIVESFSEYGKYMFLMDNTGFINNVTYNNGKSPAGKSKSLNDNSIGLLKIVQGLKPEMGRYENLNSEPKTSTRYILVDHTGAYSKVVRLQETGSWKPANKKSSEVKLSYQMTFR